MNYGEIVSRGWHITWNNKFLWVLGFLAALARISTNFSSNSSNYSSSGNVDVEEILAVTAVVLVATCFFMIIGLVLWLLSLVAKGGLISAVSRIDAGEKVTLREAFSAGTEKILTLIGMNLLLLLPVIVLIVIGMVGMFFVIAGSGISAAALMEDPAALETVFASSIGMFVFCICGLVCGIAIVSLIIQFVNAFAYRGIMLQGYGALDSISHGWQVLKANTGEILILSLIFFGISLLFGLALAMVMVPLAIAVILPAIAFMAEGGGLAVGGVVYLLVGVCFLGIIGAGLNAIITTWQSASFTLAYQEWINKPKAEAEPMIS